MRCFGLRVTCMALSRGCQPRGSNNRISAATPVPSGSAVFCQKAIQLIGKRLSVAFAERGGPARCYAHAAQFVHMIAQAEARANVVAGVELAARVQCQCTSGDHVGREWNIGSDDEIAGLDGLGDAPVGFVEAGRYLYGVHVA